MKDFAVRQLAAAVTLQAAKDYFRADDKQKRTILKDLRSNWMDTFTNGTSILVAKQLEFHPAEVEARLCRHSDDVL